MVPYNLLKTSFFFNLAIWEKYHVNNFYCQDFRQEWLSSRMFMNIHICLWLVINLILLGVLTSNPVLHFTSINSIMNSTLSCFNCVNKQMSCCKHLEYSFEVRVVQIQGTGLSGSRNSEISGGSRYRVETFFVQEQNHI